MNIHLGKILSFATIFACLVLASGSVSARHYGGEGGHYWHQYQYNHYYNSGRYYDGGGSNFYFSISPGAGYYYYSTPDYTQCRWVSGYYDPYYGWVPAQQVCW